MKKSALILGLLFLPILLIAQNFKNDLKKIALNYSGLKNCKITYTQLISVLDNETSEWKELNLSGEMIFNSKGMRTIFLKDMEIYEWEKKSLIVDKVKREITLLPQHQNVDIVGIDKLQLFNNVDQFMQGCSNVKFHKISSNLYRYTLDYESGQKLIIEFDDNHHLVRLNVNNSKENIQKLGYKYMQVMLKKTEASKQDISKGDINNVLLPYKSTYKLTKEYQSYHFVNLQ